MSIRSSRSRLFCGDYGSMLVISQNGITGGKESLSFGFELVMAIEICKIELDSSQPKIDAQTANAFH